MEETILQKKLHLLEKKEQLIDKKLEVVELKHQMLTKRTEETGDQIDDTPPETNRPVLVRIHCQFPE